MMDFGNPITKNSVIPPSGECAHFYSNKRIHDLRAGCENRGLPVAFIDGKNFTMAQLRGEQNMYDLKFPPALVEHFRPAAAQIAEDTISTIMKKGREVGAEIIETGKAQSVEKLMCFVRDLHNNTGNLPDLSVFVPDKTKIQNGHRETFKADKPIPQGYQPQCLTPPPALVRGATSNATMQSPTSPNDVVMGEFDPSPSFQHLPSQDTTPALAPRPGHYTPEEDDTTASAVLNRIRTAAADDGKRASALAEYTFDYYAHISQLFPETRTSSSAEQHEAIQHIRCSLQHIKQRQDKMLRERLAIAEAEARHAQDLESSLADIESLLDSFTI